MNLMSIPILASIFFVYSCHGQRERAITPVTPWSISGGKLYIITDPDSGESTYIPASLFFQRLAYAQSPFICDLLTRRCWPSVSTRPVADDEEEEVEMAKVTPTTESEKNAETGSTIRPSTTGGGSRGTIFGHPTFHQGEFPGPATKRPFKPWTGNSVSASAASAGAGTVSQSTSTTTGRAGTGTIFGHPNFHQGEFPEVSGTQRPFQPWAGSGASSSSSASTTDEGKTVTQTLNMRSGREKRAAYGNSASSSSRSFSTSSGKGGGDDGWEQSHYSTHGSGYPAPPVGPNFDQFAYMQQHFQHAQDNFQKSFGQSGGFAGANAGAGFGYNDNYGGHLQPSFPQPMPGPNYNFAGASSSSSLSNSSPGHSAGIDTRVNQHSGGTKNSYPASTGSGSGYSHSTQSGSHYHEGNNYGDDDMHYSTVTTKDGMMESKMEGKKCGANGCTSSSSTSMMYNPSSGSGYGKSGGHGQYSGGSSSSSSSSHSQSQYARDKGGNDVSHYDLVPRTTTNKPYVYTTTQRPYTYATTKYTTTYPTTTKYSYTYSTKKPYIYSTAPTHPPKSRQ